MANTKKILLVDDNPGNLRVMSNILIAVSDNYDVFQAFNITDAYKIVLNIDPDLIITDWEMPNGNGIEFIKQLKDNELTKEIPVIMATGVMTDAKHLKIAFEAGAIDFVRKPINDIELIARVNSVLLIRQYHKMKIVAKNMLKDFKLAKYKIELELSTVELSRKTLQIAQMMKYNNELQDLLAKFEKHCDAEVKEYMAQLKLSININSPVAIWQEFLNNFEKIHPYFFVNLLKSYPKLTPNEKRYCAYLRMDFSVSNISDLTSQSENTVKMARKRLRKTLNLALDIDMNTFLAQF